MLTNIPQLQTDLRAINEALLRQMVACIRQDVGDACWRFDISLGLAKALSDTSSEEIELLSDVDELAFILAAPEDLLVDLLDQRGPDADPLMLGVPATDTDPHVFAINLAYLHFVVAMGRADLATTSVRCGLPMKLVRRLADASLGAMHRLAGSKSMRFTPRSKDALVVRLQSLRQDPNPQSPTRELFKMAAVLWGAAA